MLINLKRVANLVKNEVKPLHLPSFTEIFETRDLLGWNQTKLAKEAEVDRSYLNQIEKGRKNPTYSEIKKIVGALNRGLKSKYGVGENLKEHVNAKVVMTEKAITLSPNDTLDLARTIMIENDFSQIPVIDKTGKARGLVTDRMIMHHGVIAQTGELKKLADIRLAKCVILTEEDSLGKIRDTLLDQPAFLVRKKDDGFGIISKQDVLRYAL